VIAYGSQFFLRKAFLLGCMDYLKEPWEFDEMEIRISLALKSIIQKYQFSWGTLSFSGMNLLSSQGQISLTYQEYQILKILLRNRGEIVPKEILFHTIWDHPGNKESRIIDVHISSLRKKISTLYNQEFELIKAVRGKGYLIAT